MARMLKPYNNEKKQTINTDKAPYKTQAWKKYSFILRATVGYCIICGPEVYKKVTDLVVDHIIPHSRNGSFWDKRNHQVICISCHNSKSSSERVNYKTESEINENNELIPKINKKNE